MRDERPDDLAKAILNGERITPSTGRPQPPEASRTGISVPKGMVPVSEGTTVIQHLAGAIPTRFSEKEKGTGK